MSTQSRAATLRALHVAGDPLAAQRLDAASARMVEASGFQRQLGHANLGTTSIYLQGIDPEEIITAVRTRRAPMMSASAGLRL